MSVLLYLEDEDICLTVTRVKAAGVPALQFCIQEGEDGSVNDIEFSLPIKAAYDLAQTLATDLEKDGGEPSEYVTVQLTEEGESTSIDVPFTWSMAQDFSRTLLQKLGD